MNSFSMHPDKNGHFLLPITQHRLSYSSHNIILTVSVSLLMEMTGEFLHNLDALKCTETKTSVDKHVKENVLIWLQFDLVPCVHVGTHVCVCVVCVWSLFIEWGKDILQSNQNEWISRIII